MAQKKELKINICWLIPLFFSLNASAATQNLGPVSIDLPASWKCQKQDQNYICLDESSNSEKNTAIVVTYKNRSPEDVLAVYRDQLSRPRTLYQGDLAVPSQPKGVNEKRINNAIWIEGIHLGSEVPDYYTHYYATIAGQYAVLISMSVEKNVYEQLMRSLLNPAINSIRLNTAQTTADLNSPQNFSGKNNGQAHAGAMPSKRMTSGKKRISILGHSFPRNYVFVGVGLILVLGLMGYALLSD